MQHPFLSAQARANYTRVTICCCVDSDLARKATCTSTRWSTALRRRRPWRGFDSVRVAMVNIFIELQIEVGRQSLPPHVHAKQIEERMQSVVYQLTHPWHWLTYGQNATAVAAIAACLGLVGLYFYTHYTRTMMGMQESTARANVEPMLVTQDNVDFTPTDTRMVEVAARALQPKVLKYELTLRVRNIGQGAALFVHAWCQPVSEMFVLDSSVLRKGPEAMESNGFIHLLQSETESLVIGDLQPDLLSQRRIIVIDALDATSLRHQLQIVQTPLGGGKVETVVNMVHADPKKSQRVSRRAPK